MNNSLVVASIQVQSGDSVSRNLAACKALVYEAADRGAKLVVLPENFAFFGSDGARAKVAERLDGQGEIMTALRSWATVHRVALIAGGMPEISVNAGRPYNTSVAVDANGAIVGCYRKLHLFDVALPSGQTYRESDATTAGDDVVVVDLAGARVGLSICYDLRFPRLFEAMRELGAEVISVPAAFTQHTGAAHWHVLLRARAIECQTWIVSANQWGTHPGARATYGHSLIADPWGTVVAECSDGVGICLAKVDLAMIEGVRERMPLLDHSRRLD